MTTDVGEERDPFSLEAICKGEQRRAVAVSAVLVDPYVARWCVRLPAGRVGRVFDPAGDEPGGRYPVDARVLGEVRLSERVCYTIFEVDVECESLLVEVGPWP